VKAVIMAGGEGTRLRPLTSNQPKPMLPLANRPLMEHVVLLLRKHGFEEIVVTVAFMANAVRSYFGDGSELGVKLVYATEETPLGTAGSVLNARDELDDRFLVISGDVLTDLDLGSIVDFHQEKGAMATLALHAVPNPLEFGIVIAREDGSVERFLEKPTWGQVFSDTINTGIYVLEPEIFDFIPKERPSDFSADVFPAVLAANRPIFGCISEGYWEDVGTTEAYLKAHHDVLERRVRVEVEGFQLRPGVWLGTGSTIDPTAAVEGPALIGDNCSIGPGVVIGPYATLGDNVRVAEAAEVHHSVLGDNCYVGSGARVEGAAVARACDLRERSRCEPGAVLGESCRIGPGAELRAGVKVYPFKVVEAGALVNSSIVWESRGARSLFGRDGVRGIANVDIHPELAVRLSMAWVSNLGRGASVTASRDTSRTARMLKRAIMVGCNAAGVNVGDLEVATVPVVRHHIRNSSARGGVTVRLAADDPQSVVIRFFDAEGLDIDENTQRKIERMYYREEFRRVLAPEIGDIDFPARAVEQYTADLIASVSSTGRRASGVKLVLDLSYGSASFVMPNVLAKIDADVLVVNPFAHTAGMISVDRHANAQRVAELVRASGSQLGAVVDADGEHLTIVDDAGTVLTDDQALLALLQLVVTDEPGARVVLPVSVPDAAARICEDAGATVTYAKLSSANLMELAASPGVAFAASQSGGFIWPRFLPAYDAAATVVMLVELLARSGEPLSKLVASLPHAHLSRRTVATAWEHKGLLMRSLVEHLADRPTVLVDGVKVLEPDGWALVLPDPEEPITHVWAEGSTLEGARARAAAYADLIDGLLAGAARGH
jgi:mannose-1-phosphate guanylyltransferase/phosphomannomutase